jgi:AraC-like DNA-binding protein
MLLFLSITGIILSVILLYFNGRNFRSSIYLGGFFFLVSFYSFLQYVMIYSKSVQLVSIFYLNFTFLGYLIGPMLYWYVRSVLTDNAQFRIRDLWHLLPAVFFIIITFSYIISPYAEKRGLAIMLAEDIGNLKAITISSMYDFFPGPLLYMSRPILVLAYTAWSAGMTVRYVRQQKSAAAFFSQRYMINWLFVLLGFLFILVTSHLLLMVEVYLLKEFTLFSALNFLTVVSGIGLVGLLISPFFFPGILYGMPRISVSSGYGRRDTQSGTRLSPANNRASAVNFEAEYIDDIGQKVLNCMEKYQPYLQADCNLAYISKLLEIPVHHLAYYFREEKKQSFTDYRNEWRIKHARKLIEEGKAKEMTLEAIGLLSGFSTRKTFIASFKKVEGVSPGVFLSRLGD